MPSFTMIPISCSGSASLRSGHQRHRHLGAAPVEGAQRQRQHRGLLRLLLRARQTRLEHCQQQARRQHQVPGSVQRQTADTNIFLHTASASKNPIVLTFGFLFAPFSDSPSMDWRPGRSMCSGWSLWAERETATTQLSPSPSSSSRPFVSAPARHRCWSHGHSK